MNLKKAKKSPSKNDEKTPRGRSVFCVSYGMAQCEPRMRTVHFNSYIVYRKEKIMEYIKVTIWVNLYYCFDILI